MTWLTLRALLARIPGIVYVAAFVLAFLVAGGYAMYHNGQAAGVRQERRKTLAVETPKAKTAVKAAEARSDTVVKVAAKARATTDALLARRVAAKQAALGELLATDIPKVQALVALDDSIATSAKVSSAVDAGAIATVLSERAPRAHLDSLRVETIDVGQPEPDHHTVLKIAGGVLVGVLGVLTLIHFGR